MDPKKLILYRDFEEGDLLEKMWRLMDACDRGSMEGMEGLACEAAHELCELAGSHGFEGNLWHAYLAYVLAFAYAVNGARGFLSGFWQTV